MQAKSAVMVVVIHIVVTNEMKHSMYITFELFVGTSVTAVINKAVFMLFSFHYFPASHFV